MKPNQKLINLHPGRGLLALVIGLTLAALMWLFWLPTNFVSLTRTGVCLLAAVVLAVPNYFWVLPWLGSARRSILVWFGLVFISLAAAAYLMVGLETSSRFLFPLQYKHTLTITSLDGDVTFRPVNCELLTLFYNDFKPSGSYIRQDADHLLLHGQGTSVIWHGWTGSSCAVTLINSNQPASASVAWDGHTRQVSLDGDAGTELTAKIEFQNPWYLSWVLFLLFFLVSLYTSFLLFAFLSGFAANIENLEPFSIFQTKIAHRHFEILLTALSVLTAAILLARYMLASSPAFTSPGIDSSIFQLVGQGIWHGQVPYRDLWDHKGPLIYFIDALGAGLMRHSLWGVWLVDCLTQITVAVLLFFFIKKHLGMMAAGAATVFYCALVPGSLLIPNMTESYYVLLALLTMIVFLGVLEHDHPRQLFWVGLLGGLSFLLRPNLVASLAAVTILWFLWKLQHKQSPWPGFAWEVAGFILPMLPVLLYFGLNHALSDLFSQMFVYNFAYMGNAHSSLPWINQSFTYLPNTLVILIMSGLGLITLIVVSPRINQERPLQTLLILWGIFLPLEFTLVHVSSTQFVHYYAGVGLLAACLVGVLVYLVEMKFKKNPSLTNGLFLSGSLILLVLSFIFTRSLIHMQPSEQNEMVAIQSAQEWIEQRPDLLMWGDYTSWNLLSGLPSGTKYIYQYPLFNKQYCTPEMAQEFLSDVEQKRPTIVDTSAVMDWTVPLQPEKRTAYLKVFQGDAAHSCLQPFYEFFDNNYHLAATLPNHFVVYLPNSLP